MVLIRQLLILLLLMAAAVTSTAASAHEKHKHGNVSTEQTHAGPGVPPNPAQKAAAAEAITDHMRGLDDAEDARPTTFFGRLTDWLGRMHPFAVHFPIALFPVALIALVLARRRGETVELIRALIIVAGGASVIAALLGWLNAGLPQADDETLLTFHRWIGTMLGVLGAGLANWAWRRRLAVNSGSMVAALTGVVLLLLVQGFLGASLTHGMEHMMF